MKMRIVIEYDTETNRAAIVFDERPAQVWKNCELTMSKITPEGDAEPPTHERSLTLYGTRTT